MRRAPFVIAAALAGSIAIAPALGHADEHDGPTITDVNPDPIDACGEEEITVTGTGFLADGAPIFNAGFIAASNEDAQAITPVSITTDTAVFTVPESERPLRTELDRVLALASIGPDGSVEVLTIFPVNLAPCVEEPGETTGVGLTPVTPVRLMDTRPAGETVDGRFAGGPRAEAGTTTRLEIADRPGVPAGAAAAVLTVTAVEPETPGFVSVHPCVDGGESASNLNHGSGGAVANAVVTALADGDVCIFTSSGTDVLVDLTGTLADDSDLATFAPERLLDTRGPDATVDGESSGGGPVADGGTVVLPVAGRADVPEDAAAVVVNVTVVEPAAAGFVSVYPCAGGQPDASNVNYGPGQTVANLVVTAVDDDGDVCLFTSAAAHLLVDVSASIGDSDDLDALVPARLSDSRIPGATVDGEQRGGGRVDAGEEVTVEVAGRGGVPEGASVVVVNVTAVEADEPGFVTVYDCQGSRPNASSLNFAAGPGVATGAATFAGLSPDGRLCVYTSAATDLLVDVTAALG